MFKKAYVRANFVDLEALLEADNIVLAPYQNYA